MTTEKTAATLGIVSLEAAKKYPYEGETLMYYTNNGLIMGKPDAHTEVLPAPTLNELIDPFQQGLGVDSLNIHVNSVYMAASVNGTSPSAAIMRGESIQDALLEIYYKLKQTQNELDDKQDQIF